MKSRRSLYILIAVLFIASLLLAACERPLQDTGATPTADQGYPPAATDTTTEESVPDAGEAPAEDAGEAPAEDSGDAPPAEDAGEAPAEDSGDAPPPEDAGEAPAEDTGDAPPPEDTGDAPTEETGEASTEEPPAEETTTDEPPPAEEETLSGIEHTVAEGETIFDIAALYNASWVIVAEYNEIEDITSLEVGSIVYIPDEETTAAIRDELSTELAEAGVGEEADSTEEAATEEGGTEAAETGTGGVEAEEPAATATTETTYVVRPGDNLYRIGLMFGISWVQIAEANGIVNPNNIKAGQELKIPVYAPGPTPQFTHVVQRGDTLLKIAQQYGVSWQAIAQANRLRPPYIIYAGQTLIIPGHGNW